MVNNKWIAPFTGVFKIEFSSVLERYVEFYSNSNVIIKLKFEIVKKIPSGERETIGLYIFNQEYEGPNYHYNTTFEQINISSLTSLNENDEISIEINTIHDYSSEDVFINGTYHQYLLDKINYIINDGPVTELIIYNI
jgi:hypothetical protein